LLFGMGVGSGPKELREGNEQELTDTLGRLAQAEVSRLRLEAEGSWLSDFFWGRGLFFEGRKLNDASARRDIYRARVAVLPSGKIISVRHVQNMTRTETADEGDLEVTFRHVYYATNGAEPSFTVLTREKEAPSIEARLRELMRSGSLAVYSRTYVYPSKGVSQVRVQAEDSGKLRFDVEPLDASLSQEKEPWPSSPPIHLAADIARGILGPGPLALLEELWFRTRSAFLPDPTPKPSSTANMKPERAPSERSSKSESSFPPRRVGIEWKEEKVAFWKTGGFAHSAEVIPKKGDAKSPVLLTIFDMTRLELGMVGGYREPEPETGPPDTGHIPSDPQRFTRVVATFNGGFQSIHGKFGMKVEGRTLVEPKAGLATLRVDPDGRFGMGTWSTEDSPRTTISLRQNLEPLLVHGTFDPNGRGHFGDHLLSSGVVTQRSAVCIVEEGHLVYAWAGAVDPVGLADALIQAGCKYAMHLDMNAGHCSLSYHNVKSFEPLVSESRLKTPEMRANPERFLKWSPKDFFYLSRLPDEESPLSEAPSSEDPSFEVVPVWKWRFRVEVGAPDGARAEKPTSLEGPFVAYGLGHRTNGSRPGLSSGGRDWVPGHRAYAALEITPGGEVVLHPTGTVKNLEPGASWIGMSAILEQGKLTDAAREVGDFRVRAAVCEIAPGVLLFGRTEGDSPLRLAESMLSKGCSLALLLDRGSHHAARRVTESQTEPGPGGELTVSRDQSWLVRQPSLEGRPGYVF
jgi:hypothetical protein